MISSSEYRFCQHALMRAAATKGNGYTIGRAERLFCTYPPAFKGVGQ